MATSFPAPRDTARDPDSPLARAFASLAVPENRYLRHQPALPNQLLSSQFSVLSKSTPRLTRTRMEDYDLRKVFLQRPLEQRHRQRHRQHREDREIQQIRHDGPQARFLQE
jgi:hypothetical protein